MPSKDYKQPDQSAPAGQAPDIGQLVETLKQVFATVQGQLQSQAPKPFDGAAKKAVDVFNDIVLGLALKFPPESPTLVIREDGTTDSSIQLEWRDDTNNADGFKLLRCQGEDCQDFTEIDRPLSTARAYSDTNLSRNTTYRYKLIAFNSRGEAVSAVAEVRTKERTNVYQNRSTGR